MENKKLLRGIGCHNGLTGKLGEEVGFDVLWVSGLEVSTSYALPDANFVSMKELLDISSNISDTVDIPIIVDCDTGFGDQNNVSYLVKQFEKVGVSAVCIEDKRFPKTNSFYDKGHKMVSIENFCTKIRAGKKVQKREDFMIVARTEALITGMGIEEALKRARAYHESGADIIFIHSKKDNTDEIKEFIGKIDEDIPLMIIPTTYYTFACEEIMKYPKVKIVIYANQGIRTIVKCLRKNYKKILDYGSTIGIEDNISTVNDLFQLQGLDKLKKTKP